MFNSFPLVPVAIILLAGFILGHAIPPIHFDNNGALISIYIAVCIIQFIFCYKGKWKSATLNSLLFIFLYGATTQDRSYIEKLDKQFDQTTHKALLIEFIKPLRAGDTKNWIVKILATKNHQNQWQYRDGIVIAHFKEIPKIDAYGHKFICNKTATPFKKNRNPNSFCYSSYLRNEFGASAHLWISNDELRPIGSEWSCHYLLAKIRNKLQLAVTSNMDNKKHSAILEAMLLGQKQNLEENQKLIFRNSGIFHLLAVSGLHVGIICIIIKLCFNRISPVNTFGFLLSEFGIHTGLWTYILITGAAPSAIRAGIMCSLYLIGKNLGQQVSTLNIIAAVFIAMLLVNPANFYKVGFQFSFLALLGIIAFAPYLIRIFRIKYKPLLYVWTIMAISFSAQLGVAPLSMYYFNSFPNYFLVTNVLTTPLTGAILCVGILLILTAQFSFLYPLTLFFAYLSNKLLYFFLGVAEFVSSWPKAVSDAIYLEVWQVVLMYASILVLVFWIRYKNNISPFIFFLIINANIFLSFLNKYLSNRTCSITVYDISTKSCTDIIFNNEIINLNEAFPIPKQTYYNEKWRKRNAGEFFDLKGYDISEYSSGLFINDHSIYIYPSCSMIKSITNGALIIINARLLEHCFDNILSITPSHIIFDSSVDLSEDHIERLNSIDQGYHYVKRDGPFISKQIIL